MQSGKPLRSISLRDRIRGCLLAGASGDALGAPVEFLALRSIQDRYGIGGLVDYVPAYGRLGAITDDTQMTLFTVDGLIRSHVREVQRGMCSPASVIHDAYRRWLQTQEQRFRRSDDVEDNQSGWLINQPGLWSSRSPGHTCISALRSNPVLAAPANNESKGCGAVMRSAPIGFVARSEDDLDNIYQLAVDAASVTHNHPSGYHAAGALAVLVAMIQLGYRLSLAVQRTIGLLGTCKEANEVVSALEAAERIAQLRDWRERLPRLGEGWVAEEVLAIAVLCALAAPTLEEAIVAAVNHDGDSDSTGAITGNIVGTLYGAPAIPSRWLELLELKDVIETLADDLLHAVRGQREEIRKLESRYPGY